MASNLLSLGYFKFFCRFGYSGFQPLLAVLNDVGQAGGGLSPRQRDALDEIARGMKL